MRDFSYLYLNIMNNLDNRALRLILQRTFHILSILEKFDKDDYRRKTILQLLVKEEIDEL